MCLGGGICKKNRIAQKQSILLKGVIQQRIRDPVAVKLRLCVKVGNRNKQAIVQQVKPKLKGNKLKNIMPASFKKEAKAQATPGRLPRLARMGA